VGVSGADTNIMSQQDLLIWKNQLFTAEVNNSDMEYVLLMTDNRNYQDSPPSEIRQRPKGLPRNEGGTGL
jgi:hypothetical protein